MAQRIGLLTLPLHTNYGGILQTAALYRHLEDLGKEVVLLERDSLRSPQHHAGMFVARFLPYQLLADSTAGRKGWLVGRLHNVANAIRLNRRKEIHRPFIENLLPHRTGPLTSSAALTEAVERFRLDGLVVGSDQVWRMRYQPTHAVADYFLGFCRDETVRKVSYAASFGVGKWEYPKHTQIARALLAQFDAISLREDSGVEIVRAEFGRDDGVHVLDPTLLLDPAFYERIAAPAAAKTGGVLLEYVLDPAPQLAAFSAELTGRLGPGHVRRSLVLDAEDRPMDVPNWLRAFMDADFVVTDSFHGTVFSIIFRKNFLTVVNRDRGADRFTSLLSLLGLQDRLIGEDDWDQALDRAKSPIDHDGVAARLEALRARSSRILADALA